MSKRNRRLCLTVQALCRMRERAKREGRHDMTHERRCARLVLQGVLTQEEAEDALTLIMCGIYKVEAPDAWWLQRAQDRLHRAIQNERVFRHQCEREIRQACEADIANRVPSLAILDRASTINLEHGRPFVWPELREMVAAQIGRHLRQQRPMQKRARAHG